MPPDNDYRNRDFARDEEDDFGADAPRGRAPYTARFSPLDSDESADSYYDDEMPVYTGEYEPPLTGDDSQESLTVEGVRRNRPATRRETIERLANERNQEGTRRYDPRSPYAAARLASGARRRPPRPQSPRPRATPPRKPFMKRFKPVFTSLYIVLILVALSGFLYFFLVMIPGFLDNDSGEGGGLLGLLPGIGSSGPGLPGGTNTSDTGPGMGLIIRPELTEITALVIEINPFSATPTLTLLNTANQQINEFALEDGARLTTRMGTPMVFAEIGVGNMVDIGYDPRTHKVVTLSISRRTWERPSTQNVHINLENSTITRRDETFSFNRQTLVMYQGRSFSVSQITPIDYVSILGIGDTAWLIQVDLAHGFLQFSNRQLVTNGRVTIGSLSLHRALDDIEGSLALPEGTHQVTIEGDNIEMFISHVTVTQGQISVVNLDNATQRMATLHVQTTPPNAIVYIDNVQTDVSEPLTIDFGEIEIRAEAPGFESVEETFNITSPIVTVVLNLVEIIDDGTIMIFTSPSNAEIFIDNVFIGFSTLTHALAPGTYRISVRLSGFTELNYTLDVPSGEEIRRHFLLVESQQQAPWPVPPTAGQPPPQLPTLPPEAPPVNIQPPTDTTPDQPPTPPAEDTLPNLPDLGPP